MSWRNLQLALIAFAIFLFTQFAQAQYAINTVAGGGPNHLAELSASLGYPASIAFDGHGNAYIADPYSSHIFEVSAGTLTVVAGNGTYGYSGDGGLATSAALNHPEGVFVDGSGNIFIADTDNSVIREVVASTEIITTVAGTGNPGYGGDGGAATAAQLYDPNGVFVDGSENIYIADTDNCLIRKFTIGGNISTVAGNPLGTPLPCGYFGDGGLATSAQLDGPEGVFVDGSGDIFIADTANSLIREVTATNGLIQTVAGNFYDFESTDVCNYSGDGNPATAAYLCWPAGVFLDSSGDIFIADTLNQVIREVTAATGDISTVAGDNALGAGYSGNGGSPILAQLNNPNATYVDGSGDIFIADTFNFVIREVTGGTISTTMGNNTLSYSGDGGLAANAELSVPGSVAIDAAGNFYIADTSNSVIRVVNTGATAITIAGVTIQPGDIQTVAGNGTACTLGLSPIPPFCGDGTAANTAMLNNPEGIFVDSLGNIFIADTGDSLIRVVNTGTESVTIANVSVAAGAIETVAGSGAGCSGTAAACGDGGPATSAELASPFGVVIDSAENIFIADTDDFVIREVQGSGTTVGTITTVAGNYLQCTADSTTSCGDAATATSAQLNYSYGLFVDAADNVYIADSGDNRIRAVNTSAQPVTIAGVTIPAGNINTVAGNGTPGYAGDGAAALQANLDNPSGVFVDSSGDIFIADTDNSAMREVAAATGFIQTVAGIAPTGNGISSNPGFSGDGGQATLAALDSPVGVFGTSAGTGCALSPCLFIADAANQRIRELVPAIFVTVTPNPVNVVVGAEQQFTATVTGTSNTAVTWQVNGVVGGNSTVGTISTEGVYQAPATVPSPATVTITAISAADGTTSGSAQATIVTVNTNIIVTVSDGGATQVYTGTTQQLSATVTGSTNTAVNWYVEGSSGGDATFGTIDSTGLYTAPTAVPTPATITVTAYSQAASNAFGSAQITIIAAPSAAEPAPQTISPGGQANYSLLLNENTGAPGVPITLSCSPSTLPAGATCTFNPTAITPGTQAVPFSLTVAVPAASASLNYPKSLRLMLYAAFLPMLGIVSLGAGLRNKRRRWLYLPLVGMLLILLNACGGGSSSSTGTGSGPQTYNVKVQGTTAAQPNPVTITIAGLTVQ